MRIVTLISNNVLTNGMLGIMCSTTCVADSLCSNTFMVAVFGRMSLLSLRSSFVDLQWWNG